MKITNMISRLLAVFGLLFIFSVSGWGVSQCQYNDFTISWNNNNYTNTDSVTSGSGNNDRYYGTAPSAGTISVSVSGSSVNLNADAATQCPSSTGGTGSTSFSVTSGQGFNISVNTPSASSKSYTLTVNFTPTASTYNVTYNGNGNTGGSVPIDSTNYLNNASVTVLGNTGNLTKTNFVFGGWNTLANGTGTTYQAGDTFNISTSTTLYAIWIPIPATANPDIFSVYNTATVSGNVLTNDTGPSIAVSSWGSPSHGSLSGKTTAGAFTYTPTTGYSGSDSFTYTIKDSGGNTSSTTVTITVTALAIPTLDIGRAFNIRNPVNTRNMPGGIAIIGNTVLCNQDSHGNCIDYTNGDGNQYSNSQLNLKYIDIDGDSSTYDSSQAQLSIPSTATVVWAGLYTQGYMNGKTQAQSTSLLQQNPVYLTIPTVGKVTSYPSNIDFYSNGNSGYSYDTYAPVPQLIGQKATVVNGWITGANIQAYTGTDSSGLGNYGAWTLVVVYSDPKSTLKNISVFDGYKKIEKQTGYDTVNIPISGFLTPSSGTVNSSLGLFVGEGDKYITGDTLSLNGTFLNSTNAFSSIITGVTTNPTFINNEGIDIQNFSVGVDGNNSHPQIIGNSASSAKITMTTTGDTYFPSMAAFTTELYTPSLCYYQSFLDASGNALSSPKKGDTITVATWFSDMQKNSNNANIETALKVQVGLALDTTNLEYVTNSTKIENIGTSSYSTQTDAKDTDLGDFNTTSSVANWNLGTTATSSSGGTFNPNPNGLNSLKAYVTYQANIQQDGNISVNNIYTVSYVDGTTGLPTSDIPLKLCADINTSISISGLLGAFNVVNANGGSSNFKDPTSVQTYLTTQVVNKPFNVKVISLNSTGDALSSYTGDVNVSLISQPDYSTCNSDDVCKQNLCNAQPSLNTPTKITFTGGNSMPLSNISYNKANKNVAFKVLYTNGNTTQYSCSLDSFAIRPDRFILSAPTGQDSELLKSGNVYNFSLLAAQCNYVSNNCINDYAASNDYNVSGITNSSGLLSLNPTLYNIHGNPDSTLHGTLSLSTNSFDIQNGLAANVVNMSFDDVAKVDIQVIDKTWAQVDITNGDTTADCSSSGAWICGDTNATFIPDHFALSGVGLYNNNNTGFTYLSDDLNMSARVGLTVTAQNALNATTQNFSSGSWENPVNIYLTVPTISGLTSIKHDINSTIDLGFNQGALTIPWNETNSSQQLLFNFKRDVNSPKNPFIVLGSNIDLNSSSLYTSTSSNTANISGSNVATQDATFLYGRTFAPRYRFTGNNGNANIFYEVYCDSDGNKSMLPSGSIGDSSSIAWYLNVNHNTTTDGNITTITEKNLTNTVTNSSTLPLTTSNGISTTALVYHGTTFPYKTTMQDTASSWLIYNPYDSTATTNEFEVEFYGGSNTWTGHNNTTTTTDSVAAPVTGKRILW